MPVLTCVIQRLTSAHVEAKEVGFAKIRGARARASWSAAPSMSSPAATRRSAMVVIEFGDL